MFGIFKKKPAEGYIAAQHTNLPLNEHMTRLIAEELPLLDSASRVRIYEILNNYEGAIITSQEELPEEIRELMDL